MDFKKLTGVVPRIILCLGLLLIPLNSFDLWLYDLCFRIRGRQTPQNPIVILKVSEVTNDSFSTPALKLAFYERLLKKLYLEKPSAVAFTYFHEDLPKTLAKQYPDLLFSGYINSEGQLVVPPLPETSHNYGINNIFPDQDGVVRYSYLTYSFAPSLALRLFQKVHTGQIQKDLLEPLMIDFRGKQDTYTTIDAALYLENRIPPSNLLNAYILISKDLPTRSDFRTPFGLMTRAEIQANILETLLENREIILINTWLKKVLTLLAIGVTIYLTLSFSLSLAWVNLIFIAGAYFLICLLALGQFKIWLSLGNTLLGFFGSYVILLGYRLRRQEAKQWKAEQEATALREMDQFKNNFISLFSHDLKTPLAKIQVITDRLSAVSSEMPEEWKEDLKNLDRTNHELSRLIHDILRVTKIESLALEISKNVIDLNRIVQECAEQLQFLAKEKNIKIVLNLEPLFSMEGDQKLIREVVANLLENAIKYSPEGKRIVLETKEEDQFVKFSVLDEGPGLDPDELPRLTRKFYRGKSSEGTKGTGLGLYLSKYFIELHGGILLLQNRQEGGGTHAGFHLPLPV